SEMLRLAGIDQRETFEAGEGVYAVADMQIAFKRPAKLDDVLIVESRVTRVRAAATEIEQLVLCEGALAVRAVVTAALVAPDGVGGMRPVRQPARWREEFTRLMQESSMAKDQGE
ncbi:MAG: hotdog domain-containing protein, partial [Pacificimonas sp.]